MEARLPVPDSDMKVAYDRIEADINLPEDRYVFFSVPYRKNWHCYVDGERVDTERANVMYTTARVSSGNHHIILRYVPVEFYIGLFFFVLSVYHISKPFSFYSE
mgnify:CR=1 FL=1